MLGIFPQNDHNIIKNSKEIINGCNENEVQFTIKSQGNVGFFEIFSYLVNLYFIVTFVVFIKNRFSIKYKRVIFKSKNVKKPVHFSGIGLHTGNFIPFVLNLKSELWDCF